MKKVLITGATGFVGANITHRVINEGFEVHILTRESSNMWRLEGILDKINDHKVDLTEALKLEEIIEKINPEYIIHLAIYGGRPNQEDEINILESNLIGTINLVNACKNIDYECFINTGSSSEYGKKKEKMKEIDECEPINMYGVTKASASMYCNYKALVDNKNIGTLRLFSPFGDFEDRGRLIPDLILGSLIDKKVRLANPDAVRDYIYIEDVCDIYLKILKEPKKLKGEIFNIGYGEQHSVKYMAETVKNIISTEVTLEYNAINGRKADTDIWVSSIEKIKERYNWKPKYNMEEGLKKSLKWFKNNMNLYSIEEK